MCFFLVAALLPERAGAHATYSPMKVNRYVKISLTGGGAIRVVWSVMYGDAPAIAIRRAADRDGDGALDDGEIQALARGIAASVDSGLQVEVDGERRAATWEPPFISIGGGGTDAGASGDRRVGPLAFSIDLAGRFAAPGPGPHVVKLDDTTPLEQLGETEIRIEEGPGTQVQQGWRGREDNGRVLRFVFEGSKRSLLEDRSIGFRFVEVKPPRRFGAAPIALAGVLVAAIAAAVLVRRRARRA